MCLGVLLHRSRRRWLGLSKSTETELCTSGRRMFAFFLERAQFVARLINRTARTAANPDACWSAAGNVARFGGGSRATRTVRGPRSYGYRGMDEQHQPEHRSYYPFYSEPLLHNDPFNVIRTNWTRSYIALCRAARPCQKVSLTVMFYL